ncbi:MAG TPA: glycosyltransferase family 1 protein [Vicinamibacterales bacterium]
MRIAIDARKYHDFGIGTYIRNLIHQLARIDHETEYVLLCRPQDREKIVVPNQNFRLVVEPAPVYSISEQIRIPMALRREHVDLFHAPHYVLPPLIHCRSVVTIHDCIHLMFPQYLPGRLASAYARAQIWTAAHRSDRILTVSETSKLDILRRFRVPADKVTVVYNAIDERLATPLAEEDFERVRARYQLKDPFALYVGNIKPHKNLERLIDAFHELRQETAFESLKLVIIGDEISKYQGLRRAVHRHKLHKHVRFFGFVPLETLAVLYRLASVFVFPSLYEGFGLPPLEAMYYGTPVVTSNVSSLPEVVGDAAILVDPYSSTSIAEGMRRALTDEDLRAWLHDRGMARAREFSWEQSVAQIRAVYGEVMERAEPL